MLQITETLIRPFAVVIKLWRPVNQTDNEEYKIKRETKAPCLLEKNKRGRHLRLY